MNRRSDDWKTEAPTLVGEGLEKAQGCYCREFLGRGVCLPCFRVVVEAGERAALDLRRLQESNEVPEVPGGEEVS